MSARGRLRGLSTSLRPELTEVDAFCRRVFEVQRLDQYRDSGFGIELLLREFLNNAILHSDAPKGKRIQVAVRGRPSGILIRVTDRGRGFDWRRLQEAPPDPEATSGRGLAIGRIYARKMRYNQRGNSVRLWLSPQPHKETRNENQSSTS
jgi:hypothetical protein